MIVGSSVLNVTARIPLSGDFTCTKIFSKLLSFNKHFYLYVLRFHIIQEYIFRVDPTTSLGLSSDCIASYCIGDVIRAHSLEVPELLPCGYLVGDNNVITVNLKGKTPRILLQIL